MTILCVLLSLLLSSCSSNPFSSRPVRLFIADKLPWEEVWNSPVWYRLVLSDGTEIHLDKTTRSVDVQVPYGKTLYAVAYPVGTGAPLGCAFTSDDRSVELTLEQGRLVSYLVDLSPTYGDTLACLDYPALLSYLEEQNVSPKDVDLQLLVSALLNNEVSSASVAALPTMYVTISTLMPGRWVSQENGDLTFWYDGVTPIEMTLSDGLHCFYMKEEELLLRVLVDAKEKRQYQSIRRFLFWGD